MSVIFFCLFMTEQQGERAHFFVYCSSPCKSVQAGKLRVRCSSCGSGAVTVDRDPQSWQDVLQPRRITVHCENDFCQPVSPASDEIDGQFMYAQFFFKCANHASLGETDEAVPLYLMRPNLRKVPCLACTDVRSVKSIYSIYSIMCDFRINL